MKFVFLLLIVFVIVFVAYLSTNTQFSQIDHKNESTEPLIQGNEPVLKNEDTLGVVTEALNSEQVSFDEEPVEESSMIAQEAVEESSMVAEDEEINQFHIKEEAPVYLNPKLVSENYLPSTLLNNSKQDDGELSSDHEASDHEASDQEEAVVIEQQPADRSYDERIPD